MKKKLDLALLFAGVLLGLLILLATTDRDNRSEDATVYFRSGALVHNASLDMVQQRVAALEGVHSAEITDQGRMLKVHMDTRRLEPAAIRNLIGCYEQQANCDVNDFIVTVSDG